MSKPVTVLIVEDDPWMSAQYVRSLEAAEYHTIVATNGLSAMDAIDAVQPAAVVLDLMLPGPNAFVLLHELQSHTDLAGIPIIIASNTTEHIEAKELALYGVREVLDKATMQPEDIVLAVRRVLL